MGQIGGRFGSFSYETGRAAAAADSLELIASFTWSAAVRRLARGAPGVALGRPVRARGRTRHQLSGAGHVLQRLGDQLPGLLAHHRRLEDRLWLDENLGRETRGAQIPVKMTSPSQTADAKRPRRDVHVSYQTSRHAGTDASQRLLPPINANKCKLDVTAGGRRDFLRRRLWFY